MSGKQFKIARKTWRMMNPTKESNTHGNPVPRLVAEPVPRVPARRPRVPRRHHGEVRRRDVPVRVPGHRRHRRHGHPQEVTLVLRTDSGREVHATRTSFLALVIFTKGVFMKRTLQVKLAKPAELESDDLASELSFAEKAAICSVEVESVVKKVIFGVVCYVGADTLRKVIIEVVKK